MHNFKEPDILLRDPALFISSKGGETMRVKVRSV